MKTRTNKQKVPEGGLKSAWLAASAKSIGFGWLCSMCLTFIQTIGQVTVLAAPTVQDFDQLGTPFTLTSVYGIPASVEAGGPTGHFLRLASQTETANNIAFDLTAPGTYSQVVVEFDFRMTPQSGRADGLSFALLNTCVFSCSGPGPHLWEGPTVAGSFGVGFDIHQNTEDAIAHSYFDWSSTGEQGANGWTYGYYDRSLDADASYGAEDFVPFPHDGNGYSPTDFWTGDYWDWFAGNPPWDAMNWEWGSPNASRDPVDPEDHGTHEHWVIRRWTSTVDGNLMVRLPFSKLDSSCGDGVTGLIFHNGVQIYSQSIAFNDTIGRDDIVDVRGVLIGDKLDFVLSPRDNDGCDTTAFVANVFSGPPEDPNNNHISLHFNEEQIVVFPFDVATFDLADGQFHRARVTLDFASGGATVSVSLDGSFTPVANHFIAGLSPYEGRVAFGARTGAGGGDHDLDNIRVEFNGPLPPVPPGLLGYWRFDEGAGTTALDSSGQGNDAPIYGASWGASSVGPVLCFDGLDDYVDISNLPDLWCQGTIEAWAMGGPEQEIVSGILADDFAVSGGEFAVYVGEWLRSGVCLEPNAWYHFAATFDGTTWKVYVNGVLRNSLATSYVFNHPNKFIGQYFGYGPWNLNGCLAGVRIYSGALSDAEVFSNFKAGRPLPPVPPGPLGYWRLNEGSGEIALDSSGLGNDAPIYGASWGASHFGPVLCFDGVDDYVDISHLPHLCQGTIEAWANGSVFNDEQEIVSGILLSDFETFYGEFRINASGIPDDWISSGVVLQPNAWYHLVATFDGSTWKVYVNGVLRNSVETSYVVNAANKSIGQFYGFGPWNWNGCLADVRIYSGALSEEEVLSNFKAGRPLVSVPVDIHPGSCPNPLNTRSVGALPVAIVGLTGFDVAAVDVSTVKLAGVSPRHFALGDVSAPFSPFLGKQDCLSDCRASGPDGIRDLMLHFDNQEVVAALGEVADGQCLVLPLTGYLTDGRPIIGEDVVLILKKR